MALKENYYSFPTEKLLTIVQNDCTIVKLLNLSRCDFGIAISVADSTVCINTPCYSALEALLIKDNGNDSSFYLLCLLCVKIQQNFHSLLCKILKNK